MAKDKNGGRPAKDKPVKTKKSGKSGLSKSKDRLPFRIMAPAESAASRLRTGNSFFEKNPALPQELPASSPVDDWHENAAFVCLDDLESVKEHDAQRIYDLLEVARQSRTCVSMIDDPSLAGLSVKFDRQTPHSALCIGADGKITILLNPDRSPAETILMFFRELRRSWQLTHELLQNPLKYEPEDAVLLNRVQQADLVTLMVRMAWELNLAGCTNAWDSLSSSNLYVIAHAFAHQARNDFRSLNNGSACRAAYDAWFESDLAKGHDRRVIHEMLLDEKGYVFGEGREERILRSAFLVGFGAMPLGGNYFMVEGARRPDDPDYAVVEDRSNANFLWFVKFERSFLDKERELAENEADILPFKPRPAAQGEPLYLEAATESGGQVLWLVPRAVETPGNGNF